MQIACTLELICNRLFRIEYLFIGRVCLAPASCAGTIGHEKSKKCSYGHAFEYFCPGNTLHKPTFGEIVEGKSQHGTHANSYKSSLEMS